MGHPLEGPLDLALVSYHLPERHGTAAGRILLATAEGLLAEGHRVRVWSWRPIPPSGELPEWCTWSPLPREAKWRRGAWELVRPHDRPARSGWQPASGAVVIADDPMSFPAVRAAPAAAITVHFLFRLDMRAGSTPRIPFRALRAERRHLRQAETVLCYSPRLVEAIGRGIFIPAAHPEVSDVPPAVDAPEVALIADWGWRPNRHAAAVLLRSWPEVHSRVPGARLRMAGRGANQLRVGHLSGVDVVGPVEDSAELLASASVVAFPCPPTSGPKVKVMEAMALGRAVLTTSAGLEGLLPEAAGAAMAVDARPHVVAGALTELLRDPGERAERGRRGAAAIAATHAPRPAARARVDALRAALRRGGGRRPRSGG